jgi:hypothetical protein
MKCPVCHSVENNEIHLVSEGFAEEIVNCAVCETVWSLNHGLMEIVAEAQAGSFLAAHSEKVDGDDVTMA